MRLVKLGLISFAFLFLLVLGMGLLLPSHVLVSRAVTVQAPPDSVRSLVFSFAKWETWINQIQPGYALHQNDSLYLGTTLVSRVFQNDSTSVNLWRMADGSTMQSTLRVLPVRDAAGQYHAAIVQWQFEQEVGWWPWQRMASMMNDKILGPMMEESLARLKNNFEKP